MRLRCLFAVMGVVACYGGAFAQVLGSAAGVYSAEFLSPPDGTCVRFSVEVTFRVAGPPPLNVRLQDELNNVIFSQTYFGTPPSQITVSYQPSALDVPDGDHVLTLRAWGTQGSAEDTLNLTVDTTPPTPVINQPQDGGCVNGLVSVAGHVSDNASGADTWKLYVDAVQIADGNGADVLYDWDTSGLPDGSTHTLVLKATDRCGNQGQSEPITVRVDTSAPNLVGIYPGAGSQVQGIVQVRAEVEDGTSTRWWVLVDGSTNGINPPMGEGIEIMTAWDTTRYSDGLHTLELRVDDGCGNTNSTFISVNIVNGQGGGGGCTALKNLIAGDPLTDPYNGDATAFRPQTINLDNFTVRDVLVANEVDINQDTIVQRVRVSKYTPFYKCTAFVLGPGSGANTNFSSGWVFATSADLDRSVVNIAFAAQGGILGERCLLFSPPGTLYTIEVTFVTRLANGRLSPPITVSLCWEVVIETRQDIRDNIEYFATVAAGATQKPKIAEDVAAALNVALDEPDPLSALILFETVVALSATDFSTLRDRKPDALHLFGYLIDSDEEPIGCLLIEQANALLWH